MWKCLQALNVAIRHDTAQPSCNGVQSLKDKCFTNNPVISPPRGKAVQFVVWLIIWSGPEDSR